MIKCSKCGYMNDDDSLFCEECGEKLEKEEKCPSCGALLKPGKKFCAKCGYKIDISGINIGDKNVIGGDVVANKEVTKVFGSATIVKNEDQTKQVRKCHICGSLVPITHGFECPDCGEFTCENCFDSNQGICSSCAEQKKQGREAQYKKAFQKAMADGKIEFAERKELFALQKSLGLDSETARRLEEEQKREDEEDIDLTMYEKKVLDESRSLFYENGDVIEALKNLEQLYSMHPLNEEILNVYIPCLAENNPQKAAGLTKSLGVDVLMAYITSAQIAIKGKKYDFAEQILKKASRIWADNVLVNCFRALFNYALYKRFGDTSFLNQAKEIANNFGEANTELELSYSILVNDYLSENGITSKSLYDKTYCKENNLYWYVMNSNPFPEKSDTYIVGKGIDCDFTSIQEAIDYAADGGTVYVRPGVYKEDLIFTKVLNLKGCTENIKEKASKDLPIVLLGKVPCSIDAPVKIEGMVFTHNSKLFFNKLNDSFSTEITDDDSENANDEVYAEGRPTFVDISANAEIKNCAFMGAANDCVGIWEGNPKIDRSYFIHCSGLEIYGSSQAVITKCIFNANNTDGLLVGATANPLVEDCDIYGNFGSGIVFYDDATGTYRNCKIHDNKTEGKNYAGVRIAGQSNPTLEGCDISNHLFVGILIKENAKGTYKNCAIHNNEIDGILVKDQASPSVESCEVFKNTNGEGLWVSGDATGTYRNCKIHDNKTEGKNYAGVYISGQSNPTLEGCDISNHLSYGIWIKENARGTIRNCAGSNNKFSGICTGGSAKPTIQNCNIRI